MSAHLSAGTTAPALLFSVLLSLPFPARAQDGPAAVHGRVVAAGSATPLAQVTVRVLGTDRALLTGADGRYLVTRLPAGTQSLSFEALGYRARVVAVPLTPGSTKTVDVALAPQPLAVEALVVTAQKRQQAVQEVPVSITVYDGEFLRSTGIGELDALSAYVPGLEVQIQSPNNAGFVVRGITSDEGDPRAEARVSVFQDGISISRAQASVVELFDMERVEVLKGPQGTLFGRAAEIGALHLVQQKPTRERAAELSIGTGNLGQWSLTGWGNAPLVEDRLFGRVAGTYGRRDGTVVNAAGGRLNGRETLALRGLLRWTPAELTELDLILNWQQDTPPGVAFLSGTFAPAPGVAALAHDRGYLGGDERFPPLGVDRTVRGATLHADHVLSPAWTLQAIAGYRSFDSSEVFDADGTAAPALHLAEEAEGEQASLELRTLFTGRRLNGSLGVSGFRQDATQRVPFRTDPRILFPLLTRVFNVRSGGAFPETPLLVAGVPTRVDALPPEIVFLASDPAQQAALAALVGMPLEDFHEESYTNDGSSNAVEVFADGTLALTRRLQVTAGVRGTYERLRAGYLAQSSGAGTLLGVFTGAYPNVAFLPTPGAQRIARQESFTSLVGRVAAGLEVGDGVHAFASYGRGRRPPVIQQTDDALGFEVLNAEIVNSYEAGVKGTALQQRLQYDVAAFYYDYNDFQTNVTPVLAEGGVNFRASDRGEAVGRGGEVSVRALLGERLSIFGNYAYLHAEFDSLDAGGQRQQLKGNTFRLSPKHSFSTGLGFTAPIRGIGELFVRPTWAWKSRVYFEEEHQDETLLDGLAPGLYQDAHGLLDVRAGITADRGRLELEVWGANLLDERYLLDAGNTGLAFWVPTYIPGPPRLFGIRVTARR